MKLEKFSYLSIVPASIMYLVSMISTAVGQDITDLLALTVESYRASADECFYIDELGAEIAEIDAIMSEKQGEKWEISKRDMKSSLGDAKRFRIAVTALDVPGNCVILGLVMGKGLMAAKSIIGANQMVANETIRLSEGGGRGRREPVPPSPAALERTPIPEERAAQAAAAREAALIADRAGVASAVREQIAPCWNPPIESAGVEPVRVTLRLQLNIQGSLREEPTVIDRSNSPGFQAAVDSAVQAVKRCTPLKLPPSVHDYWEEVQLTFDPNEAPRSTK